MAVPEQRFHSVLFARLRDYVAEHDTPFSDVTIEESLEGRRAAVTLRRETATSLVIDVGREDANPLGRERVERAREYANDADAEFFATCNSDDFFLFDYRDESDPRRIDFYYLDLREYGTRGPDMDGFVPALFDAVSHLHRTGNLPRQRERDRTIGLLKAFHSALWPTYRELAEAKLDTDEAFVREFEAWVERNDYGSYDRNRQIELAAKQYAYLLTNRILFYEVVRAKTPDEIETSDGRPLASLSGQPTPAVLEDHLDRQFDAVVEKIDYEPIFADEAGLFDAFPQNGDTLRTIDDLVGNVESEAITELDEDLLGEVYERLIPRDERESLGQFYTHPRIAEAITEWAIRGERTDDGDLPRVLDPSSGSGTFTVEAYRRLRSQFPDAGHQTLLDHVVAVDVNRFPLHLTALNLASQDVAENTDFLHAYHDSFFNVDPGTRRLQDTRIDSLRDDVDGPEEVGRFDAVVGNPPYIRQENLYPDKEHFRRHLTSFGDGGETPYYDGPKSIQKTADGYVYFLTHGTEFLEDGGRLGYIVPTKWMATQYGETLQQFCFDHYRLEAIVGFSVRAFEDALVDAAICLFERCDDEAERRETTTRFVRIREPMEPDDIVAAAEATYEIPDGEAMSVTTRDAYRVVAVEQGHLMDRGPGKVGHFLTAPRPIVDVLRSGAFTELQEFADVSRGAMTGANDFFYLTEDDLATWPIDERFRRPAIKSFRNGELVLTEDSTDLYLLDVHEYVGEVERHRNVRGDGPTLTERVKARLREDGYETLVEYVEHGEREGYHERSSVATREVWFDLGDLDPPQLLHSKSFDERAFTMWNAGRLSPGDRLYAIRLDSGIDETVVAGILNSTLHKALLELWGRAEGGGALEVMTYEAATVPVVDPRTLPRADEERIREATEALRNGDDDAQDRLDAAVLEALEIDLEVDALQEMHRLMVQRRVRSGAEADVLVERLDEFDDRATHVAFAEDADEREDASLSDHS